MPMNTPVIPLTNMSIAVITGNCSEFVIAGRRCVRNVSSRNALAYSIAAAADREP
jgi:hypothetical protein